MRAFRHGRSAHPNWRTATELLIAQLDDGRATPQAALGLLYVTERFAERIADVATLLRERFPAVQWIGASAHGVCASGAEFSDDAAMTAMICDLPAGSWRVVRDQSGWPPADPRGAGEGRATPAAFTALVHVEPAVSELSESIADLAGRTDTGFLFGGLVGGSQPNSAQLADGVVRGGISGATFDERVRLLSRVTQGCAPLAREHVISECSSHYIQRLDGHPALDVLLEDLGVAAEARASRDGDEILRALPAERLSNGLMVGLAPAARDRGIGFGDYTVRNVLGIDPQNRLLAIAATPQAGDRAVFCTRDQRAARADLVRICTELREELESQTLRVLGAHYVSCVARGEHLFGAPGAEMGLIAHNLGEVPLVGFFANGEIARDRVYGYTGVLTLFVSPRDDVAR
ncbi:MAG TPA: FIST C-terminal domain-containing protein [Burkholderiaceae bacterium]|jgi:small ligand-binding sensory domain FIST|nr:FIST C-terminal domain-containing protein [Burkholderiaceae bacterium]